MWNWSCLPCCGPRNKTTGASERQPLLGSAADPGHAPPTHPQSPRAEHDFPSPDTIITAPKPPPRMSSVPPHERLRLQRERESGSSASRQRSTSGGSSGASNGMGPGEASGPDGVPQGCACPEGKVDRTDSQDRMDDISKFFSRRFQTLTRPGIPASPSRTSAPPSAGVTRRDAPSPFTMVPLPREARTVPASPAGQSRSAGPHMTLAPAQERAGPPAGATAAERRASFARPAYVSAPPSARLPPPRRGLFDEHPIGPDSASEKSIDKDALHVQAPVPLSQQAPAPATRDRRDSSAVTRAPFINALLPHFGRSVSEPQSLQAHLHRQLSSLSASRSRSTSASAATLGLGLAERLRGGPSMTSPAPPDVDSPDATDADADSGALRFIRGYGPGRPAEIEGFAAHMLPMGKATDPRTVMVFRGRPRSSTGASATDRSAASRSRAGSSTGLAQASGVGRPPAHETHGQAYITGRAGSAGAEDGHSESNPSRPISNDGRRRSVVSVHTAGWEEASGISAGVAAGLGPGGAGRGYPGVSARRGRSPGPSRLGSRNVSADSLSMWRMDEVQPRPQPQAQEGLLMGPGAAWEPMPAPSRREASHGRRLEAIPGSEGAIALGSGGGSGGRTSGGVVGHGYGTSVSRSGGRRDRRRASPVFSLEGDGAPDSPAASDISRAPALAPAGNAAEGDASPVGRVVRLQMGLEVFGRPLPLGLGGGAGLNNGMRQTRSAEPISGRVGMASRVALPGHEQEDNEWTDVIEVAAGDARQGRGAAAERHARGRARRGGRSASRRGGPRRGGSSSGSGSGRGASVAGASAGWEARGPAGSGAGVSTSRSRGRGGQRRFVSE